MNVEISNDLPIVLVFKDLVRQGLAVKQDRHGGLRVVKRCPHTGPKEWHGEVLRCADCKEPLYHGLSARSQAIRRMARGIE